MRMTTEERPLDSETESDAEVEDSREPQSGDGGGGSDDGDGGEDPVQLMLRKLDDVVEEIKTAIAKTKTSAPVVSPPAPREPARTVEPPLPPEPKHASATPPPERLHRSKPGPKPKLRFAEVPPEPERPPAATGPQAADLVSRIEWALTRESLETYQLSKVTGESIEKLDVTLRNLRADLKVYNVGIGEKPLWTWRIGDRTDTRVLSSVVRRLIAERPMATRELADATGARMSRVGGVLIAIQRSGADVRNLGVGHAGRWFLVSDHVKDASLPPKRKAKRRRGGNGTGSTGTY